MGNGYYARKRFSRFLLRMRQKAGRIAAGIAGAALVKPLPNIRKTLRLDQKFKYQGGNSKTKTKRRKKTYIGSSSDGSASADVVWGKFPSGKLMKTVGKSKFRIIKQYVNEEIAGRQLVFYGIGIFTRAQLNGDTNSAPNAFGQWPDDPFRFDPNWAQNTTTIYPNAVVIPRTDKIGIRFLTSTLTILNMQTIPVTVTVAWNLAKRDGDDDPESIWEATNLGQGEAQNFYQERTTINSVAPLNAGREGVVAYGSYPKGDYFKSWKPIAIKRFILSPGAQKKVTMKCQINRMISKEYLEQTDTTFLRNMTIVPMIVGRAGIVGVKPNEANASSSEVTYGPTKLGVLQKDEIEFAMLPHNRYNLNRTYQGQLSVDPSVYQLRQIDDEDEVKVVEEN